MSEDWDADVSIPNQGDGVRVLALLDCRVRAGSSRCACCGVDGGVRSILSCKDDRLTRGAMNGGLGGAVSSINFGCCNSEHGADECQI